MKALSLIDLKPGDAETLLQRVANGDTLTLNRLLYGIILRE